MLHEVATCRGTWPDIRNMAEPSASDGYQVAVWLLGRHPRLGTLVSRVAGVVHEGDADGEFGIDLDHLGEVFADAPRWGEAWDQYETHNPPPLDDAAYERWRQRGPRPDDFSLGLSDLLVMSSGEVASLRVLATLSTIRIPFKVGDLASLDAHGQRLVADWCRVVTGR
jgi:hypothetical protein